MINLAEQINQLIDISLLPEEVSVQKGWRAYFLISNINYEKQRDVLPSAFVNKLIEHSKSNEVILTLGEPVATPEIKFSGVDGSIQLLNREVFDNFCNSNNLRYFFISKLVDDKVFIALTPDEYSIILAPEGSDLLDKMGGKEFLNQLNVETINSGDTDFTHEEWVTFNSTFNQSE